MNHPLTFGDLFVIVLLVIVVVEILPEIHGRHK